MNDNNIKQSSEKSGYILNSAIANFLRSHKDNSGLQKCLISKKSSPQKYYVRFFLSSPETKDPSISFFETAVMDAIISLYANNCVDFSLHSLIEFMFGQEKKICSPKLKSEISEAIDNLSKLEMAIDITDECKMRDIKLKELIHDEFVKERIKKGFEALKSSLGKRNSAELRELAESGKNHVFLFGQILPCELISSEKNKYRIYAPPLLYLYAEKISRQIISYPLTLLKHSDAVKDTRQRFLLRHFLLQRIYQMKYQKYENSNTIVLYEPNKPSVGLVPRLFPELQRSFLEHARLSLEYDRNITYIDFIRSPEFKRKIKPICKDIENIINDFIVNDSGDDPVLNIKGFKRLEESNVLKYVLEFNDSSAGDAANDAQSE